jgi:hypothetical protein
LSLLTDTWIIHGSVATTVRRVIGSIMQFSVPATDVRPLATTVFVVAFVLAPLLAGLEPVGGDPDRIYRPIKQELARALNDGALPLWSDRVGLGFPLLAESHAGALYPPNHVLYRVFDVATAYRLSMWLHNLAIAVATYTYARVLGITPWGAALAGISFTFCGFQAIHSSHEWAWTALLFLPMTLIAVERYVATGRVAWMATLALTSGISWLAGQFQIQAWSTAVALALAFWRIVADRRPLFRFLGVGAAILWGLTIATAQLGPSWELARFVGQVQRPEHDRLFYSFPPVHLVQLAIPRLFRDLPPESAYWFSQQTTGYEACLSIGTLPIVLACAGVFAWRRPTRPWTVLLTGTLALATMPRWWPAGYQTLLAIPGIGYFRCPARWTAFSSFALALLAGEGFDRGLERARWSTAIVFAVLMAAIAVIFAVVWSEQHAFGPLEHLDQPLGFGNPLVTTWLVALVLWVTALLLAWGWRRGRIPYLVPVVFAAVELGSTYYTATTRWGYPVRLPGDSSALRLLAETPSIGRVGGTLDNLPLRAGLATADPYVGFLLPPLQEVMRALGEQPDQASLAALAWLGRLGVSHLVVEGAGSRSTRGVDALKPIWEGADPALDKVARNPGPGKRWRVLAVAAHAGPRVATHTVSVADQSSALVDSMQTNRPTNSVFVAREAIPRFQSRPATNAQITTWEGQSGTVAHDGACVLVLDQMAYPGWDFRAGDGPWTPVGTVDGGLAAAWIDGTGTSEVRLRYHPTNSKVLVITSTVAATAAVLVMVLDALRGARRHDRRPPQDPEPSVVPRRIEPA